MAESPDETLMAGAPPEPERLVTLANWQTAPYNRWSFLHMRELMPTQRIARRDEPAPPFSFRLNEAEVRGVPVIRVNGSEATVGEVLDETWTDGVMILHKGQVVMESYHGRMRQNTRHLLMSVTKSVVGCVAGVLAEQGILDPEAPVESYVPEVADSGYGDTRVRDLLDMRSGVKFSEEYQNVQAEVRQIERHMGWRPRPDGQRDLGLYGYLASLERESEHGGKFVYRSADTDMLGWVIERASGRRMSELISELIWRPIGADYDGDITCDGFGSPVHDGGMSAATRDLARFGQMLLGEGEVDGVQVVPAEWLRQARTLDPDIREAFRAGDSEPYLPGGWYRNQFWHVPARSGDVQMCLGIHGQMVLVDVHTETVSVKFSSWPDPQNPGYLLDTIRAFTAAGRHLSGLPESAAAPGDRDAPSDRGMLKGPKETREENLREQNTPGPPEQPV